MTQNDTGDAIVIQRHFDAPVALIWQMWTDPEHFAAWYGPTGADIPMATMDVRVGGTRLVAMDVQTPEGRVRPWFTGQFREVVENERLVYTEAMADENGNELSAEELALPAGHPSTTEVRVELRADGDRTTMVMTHVGVSPDSPGAAGWAMALDKLTSRVQISSRR